jgi:tetratricopeptide (TPR) repeat protein
LCLIGEPGDAFGRTDEALAMARRLRYAHGEATANFLLGMGNWFVARLEVALAALLEADATFRELNDESGRAKVAIIFGAVYRSLGDLDQGYMEGLRAVESLVVHPDSIWEAVARFSLATTLHDLGDYEGARKQNEKILQLGGPADAPWITGRTLAALGSDYAALGNHREALAHTVRALKICENSGYRRGEARALHELGHAYERLGDRKKANEYYAKCLRIREETEQREGQCTTLVALGNLHLDEDYEKAFDFLHRALNLAEQIGAKQRVYQSHLALSHAHEHRGDTVEALHHYKAYHEVHDELAKLASGIRVKNLQTIYEAEKRRREAEIAKLKESLEEGTSLGSYRLTERLGAGGMGEVWRGEHRLLARPAAIKVISAQAGNGAENERLVQRFRREAEVTSSLRSPHTVQLFDFGVSDSGQFHYVMELLDGMDARQLVECYGPVPSERLVYLLRQACRSLAEAHEKGLVHRDIKPANLFIARLGGEFDFLKVLDFGMVKKGPEHDDVQLTDAGLLVGTPAFVAPEWVTGEGTPDGRADLYSLGCTAYWMLSGRTVFEAKSATAMLLAQVRSEPPRVSQVAAHAVPDALDTLLRQCLEKQPADRPSSALEVWERLGEIVCAASWDSERARVWWSTHPVPMGRAGADTDRTGSSDRNIV